MGIDAKAGFAGLVTATSEAAGAATGLRVADNVVLRKEGALMPRPVFTSSALSRAYAAAFPYRGVLFFLDGSNQLYNAAQAAIAMDATDQQRFGTPLPALRADIQGAKEARGNFYLAASQGAFKLTSAGSTSLVATGVALPYFASCSVNSVVGGILTPNQRVAYRLVQKYTDPNGLIIRSRPTGATVVDSGASITGNPQVTAKSAYAANGAYQVEIYRTRIFPSTATVDDEMQLVATITPLTTSTPNIVFVDNIPDTSRGTTLYTSPSRGGTENASDRPPGAACLERYRGSLFFGNVRGPARVTFSLRSRNVTGSTTGVGVRQVTASWTSGTSTVTVDTGAGLQPGQTINIPGSPFYSGSQTLYSISAVSGTTLTLATQATSTRSGVTAYVHDTFSYFDPTLGAWQGAFLLPNNSGISPVTGGAAPSYFLNRFGVQAYEITPPEPGYDFTTVLEAGPRGAGTLAVRASHGDEYSPAIALQSSSTGTPAAFDDLPNGLAWSEPDEPEHVPPKNFARVGDHGKGILALVATKDRLLIMKEDGLFMLTGDTAKNFAIYPLDTTCLCILPGSVRRLKNTVFLLTNLGLCAIDENGGVSVVSRPIQLEVASIVNAIRAAQKSSGLYNMPGLSGVTGAGDDAQGEYHLAIGSSTPSFGGQVLVYSLPRDGFTTFTFTTAPVALATDGEGNPLVLTSSALLTPTTTLGTIAARVSPRAFADPALLGKFWTHVLAGFSQLTGTTNVQAKFTSSASMVAGASITESFDLPLDAGTSLLQFPLGSLLRHPVPAAVRRAYMLFVELLINVSNGSFTLETIAAESRENISNKEPTHGSGST